MTFFHILEVRGRHDCLRLAAEAFQRRITADNIGQDEAVFARPRHVLGNEYILGVAYSRPDLAVYVQEVALECLRPLNLKPVVRLQGVSAASCIDFFMAATPVGQDGRQPRQCEELEAGREADPWGVSESPADLDSIDSPATDAELRIYLNQTAGSVV